MNAPHRLSGAGRSARLSVLVTLSLFGACASSGTRADPSVTSAPETAPPQTGKTTPRRGNSFVLTAAEIETVPGLINAYDAVQTLRPQFLRTRGSTAPISGGFVGVGAAAGASTGTRTGQGQGNQSGGSEPSRGDSSPSAGMPSAPADPGIVVFLERQRYGPLETLREIPVATIEEIRFLNVGEANSLFGMGYPHGVIQVISRHGPKSQ